MSKGDNGGWKETDGKEGKLVYITAEKSKDKLKKTRVGGKYESQRNLTEPGACVSRRP